MAGINRDFFAGTINGFVACIASLEEYDEMSTKILVMQLETYIFMETQRKINGWPFLPFIYDDEMSCEETTEIILNMIFATEEKEN